METKPLQFVPSLRERMTSQACPIGANGFCCDHCMMGPCRVVKEDKQVGVCGASQALIVSRNNLRSLAAGTAAHCGHTLHLCDYLGIRPPRNYIQQKAPPYLYEKWRSLGLVTPQRAGLDFYREIGEALHLTTMGVNADYQSIALWYLKLGIIDGYYGLYLSTELEDQRFGKPQIRHAFLNLDCLDPDRVNIAVHGHEAILTATLAAEALQNPDINLVGVCCTGASLLAKHGIPLSAHFNLQEEVIASGIVDAMVVDLQCIMPSLAELCECFHTKLITTNAIAPMPHALHLPITTPRSSHEVVKRILAVARENRARRAPGAESAFRAKEKAPRQIVAGFSEDNIDIADLADRLQRQEIKGMIGVVGCVNPRIPQPERWIEGFRQLIEAGYVLLVTGCVAFEFGQHNLLDGRRVFHLGSCINNARIAEIFKRLAQTMGQQIQELPLLVSAPMPMAEKTFAIALFFASLGVSIHSGFPFTMSSNPQFAPFVARFLADHFNCKVFLESDPGRFVCRVLTEGVKPAKEGGA